MTLRFPFAMTAVEDLELHQMDVISAYLAGEQDEEIYMRPPEGYVMEEGKYCYLRKSLYGLKQAARVWNQLFTKFLEGLGFSKFNADHSVLSNRKVIIAVYVDDLLLIGRLLADVGEVKALIKARFPIKDLGEANFCLGIRITRDRKNRSLRIDQSAYTQNILQRLQMYKSSGVSMPMETSALSQLAMDGEDF